jgi:hypothetical protein
MCVYGNCILIYSTIILLKVYKYWCNILIVMIIKSKRDGEKCYVSA